MKFFEGDFRHLYVAVEEVWNLQDLKAQKRSRFHMSADDRGAIFYTEDPSGEVAFREILNGLGISFKESDDKQVLTLHDELRGELI